MAILFKNMTNKLKPIASSQVVIREFLSEVPYCECAYFVKRPISGLKWNNKLSNSASLDKLNLEFSHEHIVFSQSNKNIGWGKSGYFGELVNEYNVYSECFDSQIVKKAVKTYLNDKNNDKIYSLILNNCQHFIEKIRKILKKI